MPAKALRFRPRRSQRRPALGASIFLSSWMRNSILKMACSSQRLIKILPQTAHSATICGQTGCGKTVFLLDLLERPYPGFFLCPTLRHNKTYQQCPWIWTDHEVYFLTPGERLHDYLRAFYHVFMGEPTLYIIDDCSDLTALTKKKGYVVYARFIGPQCRAICLGSHAKVQLCAKGLARVDALSLFVSLQGPPLLRRLSERG